MNDNAVNRPVPAVLASPGVVVPAELCGVLAAILDSLIEQAARPVPVGVRQPVVSADLVSLAAACRQVAVEVEAKRHRDLAAARLSVLSGEFSHDLSLMPAMRPFEPDEIGCARVAEILGVTEQRARQLAAYGRIPARRAPRGRWAFKLADVMLFAKRRGHGDGDNGKPESESDGQVA